MMRLGAEHLGSRLPVVATVTTGKSFVSWFSLDRPYVCDAQHLPLMLTTLLLKFTVDSTLLATSNPSATHATHSKHGTRTR
jgi:hypothetical protein